MVITTTIQNVAKKTCPTT